jgi:hypothetical protein
MMFSSGQELLGVKEPGKACKLIILTQSKINTHRDSILQVTSLFCTQNTFLDLKVLQNDTPFEQLHFKLQLVLALNRLGCFEDRQHIVERIHNTGLKEFLLKQSSVSKKAISKTGGFDFDTSFLAGLTDLDFYELQLQDKKMQPMQDLRYVLMKGIYPSTLTPNRSFAIPNPNIRSMISQL